MSARTRFIAFPAFPARPIPSPLQKAEKGEFDDVAGTKRIA